ncbi:STAS domain-containing protein [Colwellia sp. M166]|jgi:phospholipid transport system transporter-binding protein|uniref:STAS domain-containing protein n=1 Tax=Colwellia sp. M166 TaxID=2583805 RepID=UPI00211DEFBE|nr:STAS domain-containing protein [Colwellia sp. M166]UUO24046.1 STAS domain-containing protein [Colwellia sp. M166]|tara:strand:- start:43921 stop:44217 length:297 start_codon:yes stop_codon:yes gene_type:complete
MIDVQQADQKAIFSGALTRATITRAFDKEYRKLVDNGRVVLDLAKVSQIDTAGLAWILLLIELAASKACHIGLVNLPDDLLKLAKLSAVDTLLPIEDT